MEAPKYQDIYIASNGPEDFMNFAGVSEEDLEKDYLPEDSFDDHAFDDGYDDDMFEPREGEDYDVVDKDDLEGFEDELDGFDDSYGLSDEDFEKISQLD